MSGTVTAFYVGLHCSHWTHVPALGTPNADSGTLACLVSLQPLDEEVDALSDQLMSRLVGWNLGSKLQFLTVISLTLKKAEVRAALSIR